MSYTINKTDGEVLTTLLDGTINSDTGIKLIGRNYPTYGEIQNENFIKLLENFAGSTAPNQVLGYVNPSAMLLTQRLLLASRSATSGTTRSPINYLDMMELHGI